MELVLDQQTKQLTNEEIEAREHNAQIKERYRRLQNVEASQFAEETDLPRASVIAPERPTYYSPVVDNVATMEQAPQITEYVRESTASALFTTEKFNAFQEREEQAPVRAQAEEIAPTYVAPATVSATAAVAQYSLTAFAKVVMAAFAMVVIAMLSLIAVNSYAIAQKTVRLQDLEKQREELVEQTEEIQRRIDEARSEERIRAYAQEQGWTLGN